MDTKKLKINDIKKFAFSKYSKLDSSHDINHANRAVKLAEFLAKKEGADVLICKIGALLHQFHPEGAKEVENFLRSLDIENDLLMKIVHCVESVGMSTINRAKTLEAKVVFDSDKLQIIGPFGLMREIYHRAIMKEINFLTVVKEAKKLQEDVYVCLQTKTAKELALKPHRFMYEFFKIFNEWDKISF